MGLNEVQIQLNSTTGAYYSGETVKAKVTTSFDSPKKVRGISVKFRGTAETRWTETKWERDSNGNHRSVEVIYTGKEEYFTITHYVVGSKNGEPINIAPGTYTYDVNATLPHSLPSSFEGNYGHIRFTVTVTLHRPWKFDQETMMAFTVINPLDLNLNPAYRTPIHMQFEKTFCCFCCASPPLSVDVRIPVSGFVPGQVIPLTIFVENRSYVEVRAIKLQLRKKITYRATSPNQSIKKSDYKLVEVSQGTISGRQSRELQMHVDVPSVPPSNLVGCSLIDLDYILQVTCEISGLHLDLSDERYITIGTVPLMGTANTANAQPYHAANDGPGPSYFPVQPSAPTFTDTEKTPLLGESSHKGDPEQPPPYHQIYGTIPPPTYQESQFNAVNIQSGEHTRVVGRQDFAPRYPVYNMPLPE